MAIRVSILGGSGYTGVELLRVLFSHPEVEVVSVTSRKHAGQRVQDVFPSLSGFYGLEFIEPDIDDLSKDSEYCFTCVPHATAMNVVPRLLEKGLKVIDLSADFRIRDKNTYETWYQAHSCPELLQEAVYGLPEIYMEAIARCRLVANPGCYPTSIIIPLYPLLKEGMVSPKDIIVDSKSGTSGAGRGLNTATLFCEVNEAFKAYKVGNHRHTPEIEQELSKASGVKTTINFTPHLVPMSRGILSTIYADTENWATEHDIRKLLKDFYRERPFVKIMGEDEWPNVSSVRGTNLCHVGLKLDERTERLIIVSVIDNLCKGASGQAVQNLNIMAGLDESTGLLAPSIFP